jgi:hypothetical protein
MILEKCDFTSYIVEYKLYVVHMPEAVVFNLHCTLIDKLIIFVPI